MKTKSKDDCRNKWQQSIHNFLFSTKDWEEIDEELLLQGIEGQNVNDERDIDFNEINNGKSA